ncbi:MAG: hypothetical protein AAF386_11340, partial [Pseudomonadota bacterium]
LRATLNVNATQPGMTTDDRGDPDWDAPLGLEISLGPKTDGVDQYVGSDAGDAGFLYYWDHSNFADLSVQVVRSADKYHAVGSGSDESGHRFSIDVWPTVVSAIDFTGQWTAADLRSLFAANANVEPRPFDDGIWLQKKGR